MTSYEVTVKCWKLSSRSIPVNEWKSNKIYGLIIYSLYNKEDINIEPGYIYINAEKNIQDEETKEDNIYVKLFSKLFRNIPANVDVLVSAFCRKKKSKSFDFYPLDQAPLNQILPCFRRM